MVRFLTLLLCGLCLLSQAGFAQDEEAAKQRAQSVRERVDAFTAEFGDNQKQHFYAIYGAYNVASVVRMVQKDVGNAVQKCGAENPQIKGDMTARHKVWKSEIDAVLKEADANIDNMILAQAYAQPKDIRGLFKFLDETREAKNKEINKVPVTDLEACQYLLGKMDETQAQLTGLLRETLVSLPKALQDAQMQEEQKALDE
ncbi:MAG: hypothetical protein ACPGRX_03490 [Bdellovibrionales bacterium]